jgi:hypothetical protein
LLTATIQELQGHLSSGLITSERLTEEYLVWHIRADPPETRIGMTGNAAEPYHRDNHKGLKLRAVPDVAPRDKVMKIAKKYDGMRAKGVGCG